MGGGGVGACASCLLLLLQLLQCLLGCTLLLAQFHLESSNGFGLFNDILSCRIEIEFKSRQLPQGGIQSVLRLACLGFGIDKLAVRGICLLDAALKGCNHFLLAGCRLRQALNLLAKLCHGLLV